MTESRIHEKAEAQLKNLCQSKACVYYCEIAPKTDHMTTEKTVHVADGNASFQPFLLRLLITIYDTSLLPLLPSLTGSLPSKSPMISAELLRAPIEKSENKILSGYLYVPVTNIPEENTDDTGLHKTQQLVLIIIQNNSVLFP